MGRVLSFSKDKREKYYRCPKCRSKTKHQKVKAIAEDVTPQRESVKAKLAFFRDRVTARDQERDGIEKHHQRTDIQR